VYPLERLAKVTVGWLGAVVTFPTLSVAVIVKR